MDWKKVESSNIAAIAYKDDCLYVKFLEGNIYKYFNVPFEVFTQLLEADSVGRAFHQLVKSNPLIYPFDRLEIAD